MTREQFNKIAEINKKLESLLDVRRELENNNLALCCCNTVTGYRYRVLTDTINDLLKKHLEMLREDIDKEIKILEEEIKSI
ncbi:MAG: hypothetical protein K2G62_01485 [Oscillospiraceae bacterium]|nr:hypothetical protein [Oscillospiraceae bacterium]